MKKIVTNPLFKFFKNSISSILTVVLIFVIVSSCSSENAKEPFIFGQGYGINSSTLIVKDLEATRKYFKDTLGFDVSDEVEKGVFDASVVASVSFPDMSVFEILSLNDSTKEMSAPSFINSFSERYEGVRLYALSSSSADSTLIWLASQGFEMDSILAHRTSDEPPEGWSWDDGNPQVRTLDFESSNPPAQLPRFIQRTNMDYQTVMQEWRTYYNYGRRYLEHPNGVVGTSAIRIAVEDMEAGMEEYKKIGFEMLAGNDSLIRFRLFRNQELHLITSQSPGDDISDFLTTRGPGVFAVRFEVINLDSTYQFLKERLPAEALEMKSSAKGLTVFKEFAYGVQLEFVEEPEEQGAKAKMLRPDEKLDSSAALNAAAMFAKYCVLCHGENREGYAADHAPSLRSHSLLATSKSSNFLRYTIQYGRSGTAMAGYLKSQGGPLEYIDIELLLQWLYETSGVEEPIELSRETVKGDVELGSKVYANKCTSCHGQNGEGITAPALGNPMLLATATDHFLRHAIAEGRDGTPMVAFKDSLNNEEIDGITAFLRSRASGWNVPTADTLSIPPPEDYVLNPESNEPTFSLRDGRYLSAKQLVKALQDSSRIVILDARSEVAWRQMHIPGSIPVPYYEEPENFIQDIPNDSTWVVAYCACPHAASNKVINTLRRYGFKKTAVLDEGILIWGQLGYPVKHGK